MRIDCGCVVEPDPISNVLRSVSKCSAHAAMRRDPSSLAESYYAQFGLIRDGKLVASSHVAEFIEALGPLPEAPADGGEVLELGCGVSPYAFPLLGRGWRYLGVDASAWAVDWMRGKLEGNGTAARVQFLRLDAPGASGHTDSWSCRFGLVVAAHVIEHLSWPPAVMAEKLASWLAPGGELLLVTSDDRDLGNPDHLWFYDAPGLRRVLEGAGLEVKALRIFDRVAHEGFIYVRASKPLPADVPGAPTSPVAQVPPPARKRGRPPKNRVP